MSEDRLWDRTHLAFDDLPSLQDVLRECDRDLLVRVILADHAFKGDSLARYGKKRERSVRRRLDGALDALCELPVGEGQGRCLVLMPQESFVLHGKTRLIERRLGASLVSLADHPAAACAREALGERAGTYRQAKRALSRSRRRVREKLGRGLPLERPFAFTPWEEVLACKVWLGGRLCRRERYMVLAAAVWEMTFFGFEYAPVRARQAQERALQRCGEGCAAPEAPGCDLGLLEPDRFEQRYLKQLARVVGTLNCNAQRDFYDAHLDLARRLGLRSDG